MDSTPAPPRVFANHVIKQLIQHLFGDDLLIKYEDYQAIRVAFRHGGGAWTALWDGDLASFDLLKEIVTGWGKAPERRRTSDRVI